MSCNDLSDLAPIAFYRLNVSGNELLDAEQLQFLKPLQHLYMLNVNNSGILYSPRCYEMLKYVVTNSCDVTLQNDHVEWA